MNYGDLFANSPGTMLVGVITLGVIFVVALVINIRKARQNKGKLPSKEKP